MLTHQKYSISLSPLLPCAIIKTEFSCFYDDNVGYDLEGRRVSTPVNSAYLYAAILFAAGFGFVILTTTVANILAPHRSEEHTSELQSRFDLVCRLLLEKKKK